MDAFDKGIQQIKLKRTSDPDSRPTLCDLCSQYAVAVNGVRKGTACSYLDNGFEHKPYENEREFDIKNKFVCKTTQGKRDERRPASIQNGTAPLPCQTRDDEEF